MIWALPESFRKEKNNRKKTIRKKQQEESYERNHLLSVSGRVNILSSVVVKATDDVMFITVNIVVAMNGSVTKSSDDEVVSSTVAWCETQNKYLI